MFLTKTAISKAQFITKNTKKISQTKFLIPIFGTHILTTTPFKIQRTSEKEEDATEDSSITGHSKAIWDSLTPTTKRKTKITLCESQVKGVKNVFRKEIGVNLSNPFKKNSKKQQKE